MYFCSTHILKGTYCILVTFLYSKASQWVNSSALAHNQILTLLFCKAAGLTRLLEKGLTFQTSSLHKATVDKWDVSADRCGIFQKPFLTDLVHYHLRIHCKGMITDWTHSSGLILCCQISAKPWRCLHFFRLLDSFEGHLSCIFQQLQASGCAGVMPATVASVASLLANSQPAPTVRKASQPGLQDHCPKNRRGSQSNELEPVEMQLRILWPGEADRVKILNLVSFYLKMQHATTNLSPGDLVEPAICWNKVIKSSRSSPWNPHVHLKPYSLHSFVSCPQLCMFQIFITWWDCICNIHEITDSNFVDS